MPFAWLLAAVLSVAPNTVPVELRAERLLHDEKSGLTTGEGAASLRAPEAALDADRVVWDHAHQRVTAVGHVTARVARGGLLGIRAESITLRFDGDEVQELWLLEGQVSVHAGLPPAAFLAANTPEALVKAGVMTSILRGNHLVREGKGWKAESIDVVPCDCDLAHPSWHLHSTSASLDDGAERFSVWNPTIWVGPVPLPFWAPWLSLPTSDRQTGLLFPKPYTSSLNGLGLELPVFITLGRSADLTLTPGYYSGGETLYGLKGPRLSGEFRYRPAEKTEGRLLASVVDDQRLKRDPYMAGLLFDTPRGFRWDFGWQHRQALGGPWSFAADAAVHSDGNIQSDVVSDVLAREGGYLRSGALLARRTTDTTFGLDVGVRQDVRWGYELFGRTDRPAGSSAPVYGPNPLQRLPALSFGVAPVALTPWLTADLASSAVRLAPFSKLFGDEGPAANEGRAVDPATGAELSSLCLAERLYFPFYDPSVTGAVPGGATLTSSCGLLAADKVGQGDRVYQPGEREARDRLDLLPRLRAAAQPFGVLSVSASAAWRQGLWWGELTGRSSARGYPVLGARAETQLRGDFGTLSHLVTPAVEVRAVPFVLGTAPAPYDAIDLAMPDTRGRAQGLVVLEQRLLRRGQGELVRLDLGQGLDLAGPTFGAPRLNESFGRFRFSLGPLTGSLSARGDTAGVSSGWRLTRGSASLGLDDGRGDLLGASLEQVLDEGTAQTRRPLDLLFGAPLPPTAQTRSLMAMAGARARVGMFALGYSLLALSRQVLPTDDPLAPPLVLAQHALSVGFMPACDCWRVDVYASQRPLGGKAFPEALLNVPDFGMNVTVSKLGSIGTGR